MVDHTFNLANSTDAEAMMAFILGLRSKGLRDKKVVDAI